MLLMYIISYMPIFEISTLLSFLDIVMSTIDIFFQYPVVFAGCLALPTSLSEAKELREAMKNPLTAEQFRSLSIFETDELYDDIGNLEEKEGKGADVRELVRRHLRDEMTNALEQDPDEFEKGAASILNKIVASSKEGKATLRLMRVNWQKVKPKTIAKIIADGADINVADRAGDTPLHNAACFCFNLEVTTILLEAGADMKKFCVSKYTPFHCAMQHNPNIDIIHAYLERGETLTQKIENGPGGWCSMLHLAAMQNPNLDILQMCLDAGLSVHEKDGHDGRGYLPLELAARWNPNPEVIATLIKESSPVQKDNGFTTLLHCAARSNPHPGSITLFLNLGIDIEAVNRPGKTPLQEAAMYNDNPQVIIALLEAGANANVKDEYGDKPLDEVKRRWRYRDSCPELFSLLEAKTRK